MTDAITGCDSSTAPRIAGPAKRKGNHNDVNDEYTVNAIGIIESPITACADAPRQGSEGAPDVWLNMSPAVAPGLDGISVGSEVVVITWLHLSSRGELRTRPRSDPSLPITGVFATRSPDRPNPIGLHKVTVKEVVGRRLLVGPLEAIDGTPIIDIKPVLADTRDF